MFSIKGKNCLVKERGQIVKNGLVEMHNKLREIHTQ